MSWGRPSLQCYLWSHYVSEQETYSVKLCVYHHIVRIRSSSIALYDGVCVSCLPYVPERVGDVQLSSPCSGAGRTINWSQLFASSCSWFKIILTGGRFGGCDQCSASQAANKRFHNASENPKGGRLGFSPPMTLSITVASFLIPSKGRFPVNTYQGQC